jgi:hypothetical protein
VNNQATTQHIVQFSKLVSSRAGCSDHRQSACRCCCCRRTQTATPLLLLLVRVRQAAISCTAALARIRCVPGTRQPPPLPTCSPGVDTRHHTQIVAR